MQRDPLIDHILQSEPLTERERELYAMEPNWAFFSKTLRGDTRLVETGAKLEFGGRALPLIAAQLRRERDRFTAGEREAIAQAVLICAYEGVPMPGWLVEAVKTSLEKVYSDVTSLHEQWGLERILPSKGKRALSARRDRALGRLIYMRAGLLMATEGLSRDVAIVKCIESERLSVGRSKALELFIETERAHRSARGISERIDAYRLRKFRRNRGDR